MDEKHERIVPALISNQSPVDLTQVRMAAVTADPRSGLAGVALNDGLRRDTVELPGALRAGGSVRGFLIVHDSTHIARPAGTLRFDVTAESGETWTLTREVDLTPTSYDD